MVDAIVVTWNSTADTVECVRSLATSTTPLRRIRVIDNGSDASELAALKKELPDVSLIESPTNIGFAGGCNLGIAASLRQDADFVWIVNNDAVVERDALQALLETAGEDSRIGIVGSRVVYASEPSRIWHEGGIVDAIRGIAYNARQDQPAETPGPPRDTPYVSGCSMLLRTSCVQDVGPLDTRFFLYFEDAEVCMRATRRGWRVVIQPRSVVHHKVSSSTSRIPDRVAFLKDRNRTLFALSCSAGRRGIWLAFAYHGARAIRYWLIPPAGRSRAFFLAAFRSGVRAAASEPASSIGVTRPAGS